ncbi:MAG: DUF2007 domain-containing protein [Myxococcota bacterium]
MEVKPNERTRVAASFTYPYEADLAKALLESHNIPAWVLDDLQIQQKWHLSQALGGVKVAVIESDLETAREILATDASADLSDIPEASLPPHADEICPECGHASLHSKRELSRSPLKTALSVSVSYLLGFLYPLRTIRESFECGNCNHTWQPQSQTQSNP